MLKVSLLRGQIIDIKHSKGYDRVYSKRFSLFHIRCIWGRGSTSDHQIIERSDLVKPEKKIVSVQLRYYGLADRGIMVQYPFANLDVYVNTPTLLSGRSQLEPNRLVKYRRMTSKRIHIERNIGLAKSYKIMSKEMYQKVGFNVVLELYIFALPGKYQRHHCRQVCMSPSPM